MDNYLVDRATLEQFVDSLMKQKPLAAKTPEQLNDLRERMIKTLDDRIGYMIFYKLTDEQLAEVNELLDDEDATESEFQDFFEEAGVDLQEVIKTTAAQFGREFLGAAQ